MQHIEELLEVEVEERLLIAARNATGTCLSVRADDRAVLVFDGSTRAIAAALVQAMAEIGATVEGYDLDAVGERPHARPPGVVLAALKKATVSILAVTTPRGELTVRRAIIDVAIKAGIRHAHMPSITKEVFRDGLAMDYKEVSRFISSLAAIISQTTSLKATSVGGTEMEVRFPSPPEIDVLDGLITPTRWQNLPSGQLIVKPTNATGLFVVDQGIGDWFEHEFDVSEHPVAIEFERGIVRSISCENKRLERQLGLFIRSAENSGRISEFVIGANLGLTQNHTCSLFQNYRPGASIAVGRLPGGADETPTWTSPTYLPLMAKAVSIHVAGQEIMTEDNFAPHLL